MTRKQFPPEFGGCHCSKTFARLTFSLCAQDLQFRTSPKTPRFGSLRASASMTNIAVLASSPQTRQLMKQIALVLLVVFLAGCAAPPPVRIASSIIGRNVLHQAKDEMFDSDDTQSAGQDTAQSADR
jgi:hypothetical protein